MTPITVLARRARCGVLLVALAALSALSGCAIQAPAVRDDDAAAAALGRFTVAGKVGWQAPDGSGRAGITWVQDDRRARLVITGPLGAGAVVLEDDADGARLLIGQEVRRGVDARSLLEAELGLPLPVAQARFWVRGVVAPGRREVLARDEAGRVSELEQAGWNVRFERWRSVDGFALPTRVVMRAGTLQLRFVATRWQPLVAEFPARAGPA